jgi:hypothetical protein
MGRSCSVCRLPSAGAINDLLRSGRSATSVAREFTLSDDSVGRHRHHVPKDAPSPLPASGDPLDELVSALRVRALAGNPSDTREYRLALAAQADVRHATPPRRDLASEAEWVALRTAMLHALEPFPEARIAIAAALGDAGMD